MKGLKYKIFVLLMSLLFLASVSFHFYFYKLYLTTAFLKRTFTLKVKDNITFTVKLTKISTSIRNGHKIHRTQLRLNKSELINHYCKRALWWWQQDFDLRLILLAWKQCDARPAAPASTATTVQHLGKKRLTSWGRSWL